jgi:hypothetical protein
MSTSGICEDIAAALKPIETPDLTICRRQLEACRALKLDLCIIGTPGQGKSTILRELARTTIGQNPLVYQSGVPPRHRRKAALALAHQVDGFFATSTPVVLFVDEFDEPQDLPLLRQAMAGRPHLLVLATNRGSAAMRLAPCLSATLQGVTKECLADVAGAIARNLHSAGEADTTTLRLFEEWIRDPRMQERVLERTRGAPGPLARFTRTCLTGYSSARGLPSAPAGGAPSDRYRSFTVLARPSGPCRGPVITETVWEGA